MARRVGAAQPTYPERDLYRAQGHRGGGNKPLDRADLAADRERGGRIRVADVLVSALPSRACRICGRLARGSYYTHLLRADLYPTYAFCSDLCHGVGAAIAKRLNGMIDKTDLETKAIKEARRPFAEVIDELGLMPAFEGRSAAEIDRIIEACVDGFREGMGRVVLNDDIPF